MIKKKSNVRKYSRKVKNKKVKYSKKLMSGSGVEQPVINTTTRLNLKNIVKSISSKKTLFINSQGFIQVSKPIQLLQKELNFLYECKSIKKYKQTPFSGKFFKYKCFYQDTPKVKKSVKTTISQPLPKRKKNRFDVLEVNNSSNTENNNENVIDEEIDEEIEDDEYDEYDRSTSYKKDTLLYVNQTNGESFSVYERTNQSIGIEYNKDKKFKDKGQFYDITPLELSVDTIQLAVNTGKIKISSDDKGNSYLGFVDFPSLVITEKSSGSGFSYTSREHAEWISVYEEKFEEKDKVFALIETTDGRHIEQTTFDSEIESIDVKISKLDKDKNSGEISKLEDLKPKTKGDVQMTNEALFIKKQEEMRQLLSKRKSDENAKLKLKIEEQVKYRAYVNIEEDGDDGSNKNVITEDISWAMKNSLWLEEYLKLNTKYMTSKKKEDSLKANKLLENIGETYECDLSGLDEKYLIVEEFKDYVICGYPDKKMKEHIINFWQDEKMRVELDKIHEAHTLNLGNLLVDFYNSNTEYKDVFPPSITDHFFKLYYKVRQQDWKYIINYFTEKYNKTKDDKYKDFENNFKKLFAEYYNKIAKIYLNKPNIIIKYVFLIFKKETNKLIPDIFNFKELDIRHKSILERINIIIKKDISKIFNIINDTNYVSNDTDINEYKLYYSYYKYGTFFHIKTEYLHSMTNVFNFSHHYINTIILEELIYSCNYENFNKNVKLNYLIREYLINKEYSKKNSKELIDNKHIIENRSDYVFEEYNKYLKTKIDKNTNEEKDNEEIKQNIHTFLKSVIILVFKDNKNEYLFIYKYNNEFYKIAFKSYMSNNLNLIITQINNMIKTNIPLNIIAFQQNNKLFEILLCKKITNKDYKNIFKYNPINLKKLKINNIETELILQQFYASELIINFQPEFKIDNLFNNKIHYPILIDNYLKRSDNYLNRIKIKQFNPISLTDTCNIEICQNEKIFINNVYYDDDNSCGYNIIETFYDNRIIIWILPSNLDSDKQTHKYLGNFLHLDKTSLPILNKINTLYNSIKYIVFAHTSLAVVFNCLHFHIIPINQLYKRNFPNIERGTYIFQDRYINRIINNIIINSEYFENINYNLIKQ